MLGGQRIPKGEGHMGTGKQTEQQYLPGAESGGGCPAALNMEYTKQLAFKQKRAEKNC